MNTTPHGSDDNQAAGRRAALLSADAAIADDDLDDEMSSYAPRPAATSGQVPSQVYSIRVPVDRLEQVRWLAAERNMAPAAMLRQWVLAQLDAELAASGTADRRVAQSAARNATGPARQRRDMSAERLETTPATLTEVTASLTKTVGIFAEMFAKNGLPGPPSLGPEEVTPLSESTPLTSIRTSGVAPAFPAGRS